MSGTCGVSRGHDPSSGATITSAYLSVYFTSGSLDEPDVTIYGLDTATPAQFAAGSLTFTISNRARTTASVNWSNTNAGAGAFVNTSDISTIVQELVDSYAPYSSGVMGFVWTSRANDTARDTSIESYDGSTSNCAKLHIEYTASETVAPAASSAVAATTALMVVLGA